MPSGSKGGKQPYAIAMKDRSPFGIAGIWENWKNPEGEWVRTFAILTTPANELIKEIETNLSMSEGKIDTQALTVRSNFHIGLARSGGRSPPGEQGSIDWGHERLGQNGRSHRFWRGLLNN